MEYNKGLASSESYLWLGKDAEAEPSPYLDAVLELSPGYVAALSREAEARARFQEEGPEEEVDDSRDWVSVAIDIDEALAQLPQRDLDHARAVYGDMAASPIEADRQKAAQIVPAIVGYDHALGLQLWDRLLSDRSETVRRQAVELLRLNFNMSSASGAHEEHSEAGLRRLGLTWREAFHLMRAYAEGEQGAAPRDIGRIVLDRLLKAEDDRETSA